MPLAFASARSVQPTRSSVAQPARSSTLLTSFSPSFTSIGVVRPSISLRSSATPRGLAAFVEFRLDARQMPLRARLNFGGGVGVEPFDPGQFVRLDERQLLDRAEPFGSQQLGDGLVDVERGS